MSTAARPEGWGWPLRSTMSEMGTRHFFRNGTALCYPQMTHDGGALNTSNEQGDSDCAMCAIMRDAEIGSAAVKAQLGAPATRWKHPALESRLAAADEANEAIRTFNEYVKGAAIKRAFLVPAPDVPGVMGISWDKIYGDDWGLCWRPKAGDRQPLSEAPIEVRLRAVKYLQELLDMIGTWAADEARTTRRADDGEKP